MVNTEKLDGIIKGKGVTREAVAHLAGMTPRSFSNKAENITEFKASEIKTLGQVLGLKGSDISEIFFCE